MKRNLARLLSGAAIVAALPVVACGNGSAAVGTSDGANGGSPGGNQGTGADGSAGGSSSGGSSSGGSSSGGTSSGGASSGGTSSGGTSSGGASSGGTSSGGTSSGGASSGGASSTGSAGEAGASGQPGGAGGALCAVPTEGQDCDDHDACTIDTCAGNGCVHEAASCSDGDACTLDQCHTASGCLNPRIDICVPNPHPSACPAVVSQYSSTLYRKIWDLSTFTENIEVSGLSGSVWGVIVTLNAPHARTQDLDISLTSPDGTLTLLSHDNGGTTRDVFAGTTFFDGAETAVTVYPFQNEVVAERLVPEGALAAMRGDNPNGQWTLSVSDDTSFSEGTLVSWGLELVTLERWPSMTAHRFSDSPGSFVSDTSPVAATLEVSGLDHPLCGIELDTSLLHTFTGDLEITLESPAGTRIAISAERGAANADVFNGTTWNDSSDPVSTYLFPDGKPVAALTPEGSFDQVLGEDANGIWTLHVEDLAAGDEGTLVSWGLNIGTCSCED